MASLLHTLLEQAASEHRRCEPWGIEHSHVKQIVCRSSGADEHLVKGLQSFNRVLRAGRTADEQLDRLVREALLDLQLDVKRVTTDERTIRKFANDSNMHVLHEALQLIRLAWSKCPS